MRERDCLPRSARSTNNPPNTTQKENIMTTTNTPSIWLGCLNCYNNARLVGAWYDAVEDRKSVV